MEVKIDASSVFRSLQIPLLTGQESIELGRLNNEYDGEDWKQSNDAKNFHYIDRSGKETPIPLPFRRISLSSEREYDTYSMAVLLESTRMVPGLSKLLKKEYKNTWAPTDDRGRGLIYSHAMNHEGVTKFPILALDIDKSSDPSGELNWSIRIGGSGLFPRKINDEFSLKKDVGILERVTTIILYAGLRHTQRTLPENYAILLSLQ